MKKGANLLVVKPYSALACFKPMNPVIAPGDRVSVENTVKGFTRGYEQATVLNWTSGGNLRVKLDGRDVVKVVRPERVRKVANGPT